MPGPKALAAAVIGLMLAHTLTVGTASAAGIVACRHYARTAVHQWRLTQSIPACQVKASRRWHGSFEKHLTWCRQAKHAELGADADQRQAYLASCRAKLRRA